MTLISELATGGELLDVVTCNKYITEIEVARIIQQILEGVEYMHSKSIGHLGLTPLDILFSRPGGSEIKICDFSLARRIVGIVKLEYGQPEYVSPEIVNGEGASFASDLWAVGIITYLLLSGVSPFRGQVRKYYVLIVKLCLCSHFEAYSLLLTYIEFVLCKVDCFWSRLQVQFLTFHLLCMSYVKERKTR